MCCLLSSSSFQQGRIGAAERQKATLQGSNRDLPGMKPFLPDMDLVTWCPDISLATRASAISLASRFPGLVVNKGLQQTCVDRQTSVDWQMSRSSA